MDKNLLKIGSLILIAIVVVVLLIYGNPNAPLIIEKGHLKLVTVGDIKISNIEFYNGSKKILSFDPFGAQIKYKREYKRIFGYSSNISLFNGSDSKKVEIEGNKMIITYFNDKKDPKEVSIIFMLNNNTLKWNIDGNFSEPEKFEEIIYPHYFINLNYTEFITPSDDVIKNEGNESYIWAGALQIPAISKNYQLMVYNEMMLNVSGNFNKIVNTQMYASYFYVNPNETLTIKVQEPIELNLTKTGMSQVKI